MDVRERSEPAVAGGDPLPGLLTAVADGDQAAFANLYKLTSPKLFAIGIRLMRSRDQADDLLQETYIKVWHKARLFDPARGSALGWLIAILRRCALDRLRQAGRRQQEIALDAADGMTAELRVEFDPDEDADRRRVHRCLQKLDESKRRAILLAFYYGLTHEELAGRLSTPVGTVKSWIRRGLKSLKECLGQ